MIMEIEMAIPALPAPNFFHLRSAVERHTGTAMGILLLGAIHGGQRGIRTLVTFNSEHAFQACAIDHSAICPFINVNVT